MIVTKITTKVEFFSRFIFESEYWFLEGFLFENLLGIFEENIDYRVVEQKCL